MALELRTGTYGQYYTNSYNSSQALTMAQMEVNAKYFARAMAANGWTYQAIAAVLGNAQSESAINPGRWQGNNVGGGPAYGLLQWDPFTKYTNWCSQTGRAPESMDSAVARIIYELQNGLQYYATNAYPLSFAEFSKSTASPTYLANAWINNYERPANPNQPARGQQAEHWYSIIAGETPEPVYTVTVTGGTPSSESGHKGDTFTITSSTPPDGYEFDHWDATGVTLANPNASTTTVTIGEGNGSVSAYYRRRASLITIIGGTADVTEGRNGSVTNIHAIRPKNGRIFTGWTATSGTIGNQYYLETTYTFSDSDATIRANYKSVGSSDVTIGYGWPILRKRRRRI